MRPHLIATLATIVVVAFAHANESAEPLEQAKARFKAGVKLYENQLYDLAQVEFEAAYAITPVPAFLFNIGQCNRLRGQREAAIEAYEGFLKANPSSPAAPEAIDHLKVLRVEVLRDKEAARKRELASQPLPSAEDAARREMLRHRKLGDMLSGSRIYRDAMVEYRKAYEVFPDATLHVAIGDCQLALGDKAGAVKSYVEFLKTDSASALAKSTRVKVEGLSKQLAAIKH